MYVERNKVPNARILIVEDHPLMREGLITLIEREPDLAFCGYAEDVDAAVEAVGKHRPDLVLVDLVLADSSGIQLLRRLRNECPQVLAMVLSVHEEVFYVERAFQAGAKGYVCKLDAGEELVKGIRQVLDGDVFLGGTLAAKMGGATDAKALAEPGALASLSRREFEVFELIGRAKSPREIAERLNISIKTVSAHREKIKRKLQLRSTTEVLVLAIRWIQYGGRWP